MDEATVNAVLTDWRSAQINEKLRATLGFLEKLTLSPTDIGPADVAPLRAVGLSDQAISEAIYACFLFNVVDRLADAFDFDMPTSDEKRRVSSYLFNLGYSTGSIPG